MADEAQTAAAPAAPTGTPAPHDIQIPKGRFDEEVGKRRAAEQAATEHATAARHARTSLDLLRAGIDLDDDSIGLALAHYDRTHAQTPETDRPKLLDYLRSEKAPAVFRRAVAPPPAATPAAPPLAVPQAAPAAPTAPAAPRVAPVDLGSATAPAASVPEQPLSAAEVRVIALTQGLEGLRRRVRPA